MPSPSDIYRTAKLLIDNHGEDAALEAAIRADDMLEKGDLDGQMVWIAVWKAVEELQSDVPSGSVH